MANFRSALAVMGLCLMPTFAFAAASLQDATNSFRKGQYSAALEQVNSYLGTKPKDAQGRFLKGLILTELNRPNEAIETFSDLTDEFPELPEPYNNLAVLYANQGQFERAKNSLEMAIRTHPSYATAHENLGDIYAKMASMSYNKALQLDKSNASAQTKLALVKDLFAPPGASKAKPEARAATMKPATTAQATAPVATAASATPAAPMTPPTPTQKAGTAEAAVEQVVLAWAAAWSRQDLDGYLGAYVDQYAPPGTDHQAWKNLRTSRVTNPAYIRVGLDNMQIKMMKNKAIVTFKQRYESNTFRATDNKTLVLELLDGTWKITEEII